MMIKLQGRQDKDYETSNVEKEGGITTSPRNPDPAENIPKSEWMSSPTEQCN